MKGFLQQLFDYNFYCNKKLIGQLHSMEQVPDDLNKRVEYENSEGRTFANDVKDILFHVVNHSTHHRGQIMMDLRVSGIAPEPLDYIFYKR